MRNRNAVGYCLAVSVILAALLVGCVGSSREGAVDTGESRLAATLKDIGGAPAALAVSEPLRPFFAAGLGFIVLGGVTVCFGGRGTGLLLMSLGLATTATGVLFVQYPWAVLVLALAAGIVAFLAVYDRLRTARELARNREALEATAEVIQNVPEGRAIKAGLSGLGSEIEARIRAVIDPIKEKLRSEGRIE